MFELDLLSQLLRVRLAHRAIIDVNIIDEAVITRPPNLDWHFGKFAGWFTGRPRGDPCFLLLIRSGEFSGFDHVIAFYINQPFFKIPRSELARFAYKLYKPATYGVVMIKTDLPVPCYPSALLQTIESMIGPHLVDRFRMYQIAHIARVTTFESTNAYVQLPRCNIWADTQEFTDLWASLRRDGIKCFDFNAHKASLIPQDFDILRVKFQGHYYYGSHYKRHRLLIITVCHEAAIRPPDSVHRLLEAIKQGLGSYKPDHVIAARFKSKVPYSCGDKIALEACGKLLSFPMLIIRDTDVNFILHGEDRLVSRGREFEWSQDRPEILAPDPSFASTDYEPDDLVDPTMIPNSSQSSVTTVINFDGADSDPGIMSVGSSQFDSQSPIMSYRDELDAQVSSIVALRTISQSHEENVPPPVALEPRNDSQGRVLHDEGLFYERLKSLAANFDSDTLVTVSTLTGFDNLAFLSREPLPDSCETAFTIVPLVDHSFKAVLVVDDVKGEWIYLDADNSSQDIRTNYDKVKQVMTGQTHVYSSFTSSIVDITSYFHSEYKLMHLLMSVYHLGKAFRYASILPKKIIYSEKDFRRFCHELCREQAVSHQLYNLNNNLVASSGLLCAGAYVTFPSPLQYQVSVVKNDQCIFCKKRYFKNLGSHMAMAHGGHAVKAREARRQRELS